jgi:hypothetical protein
MEIVLHKLNNYLLKYIINLDIYLNLLAQIKITTM